MKIGRPRQSRAMRATLPTPGQMPKGIFFTDEFLPYLLNEVANRLSANPAGLRQCNISFNYQQSVSHETVCSHDLDRVVASSIQCFSTTRAKRRAVALF